MISKFVVLLAVVSQICAFKYSQESSNYGSRAELVTSGNCKYEYPTATAKYQKIIASGGHKSSESNQNQNVRFIGPSINVGPVSRNLVARGKYPVTLQNSGPAPDKKIPIITSHLRAPLQEKPTVRLPTKIPAPKTVAHSCTCFKTIIKPRVHQHIITVPSIQRYIETVHRPVIENIHYEGYPIKCLESDNAEAGKEKTQVETFQVQTEALKKSAQIVELPKTQVEKVQIIEIPRLQFSQGQESQTIEIPRVQFVEQKQQQQQAQEIRIPRIHFVESQKPQTVEVPRVQFIESQRPETFEIPQTQFSESKKPQIIEVPSTQFLENKSEAVEVPRLEFLQAPKLQAVEIPRIRVAESPEVQTLEIPRQGGTFALGSTPLAFRLNN